MFINEFVNLKCLLTCNFASCKAPKRFLGSLHTFFCSSIVMHVKNIKQWQKHSAKNNQSKKRMLKSRFHVCLRKKREQKAIPTHTIRYHSVLLVGGEFFILFFLLWFLIIATRFWECSFSVC